MNQTNGRPRTGPAIGLFVGRFDAYVEAVRKGGMSYYEAEQYYDIPHGRIQNWERIYLTEGSEGLAIERRGRGSKGRPNKLPKSVEEDTLNPEHFLWKSTSVLF